VLVEPTPDPDLAGNQQVAVYSFLPGQNLQHLSESSEQGCQLAARLVIEATSRLALLTPDIEQQVSPDLIPRRTLTHQLAMIVNDGSPWLQDKRFLEAIKKLAFVFRQITDPLVFTNGDYQPANFLTDDEKVTGFVDFEHASYQDFLFGFVKYPIYDLHPLNKGGMISHLLKAKGISFAQFAPRLALGCLQTLQQEIPITEGADRYRHHVTGLLKAAVAAL
jgi:hypothetical protein